MTTVQVYFNKPGRPFDIALLIRDIRAAQEYVLVASAWFTDTDAADAIIAAPAAVKTVILNAADLTRASVEAYHRLERYFATAHGHRGAPSSGLYVLGGEDWRRDGMMHHKFVVVDPGIVWIGTISRPSPAIITRLSCALTIQPLPRTFSPSPHCWCRRRRHRFVRAAVSYN